ncbi:hypothetical protein VCSRO208_1472 [Vibrio cholerae]|nr:hypothetical protein VCSRO208_1472 [Vibrio cholerae]GHY04762.1 hypothetical protein VCSRO68_2165 [Vibrio cholerae]GHY58435.1 hypothetical protein VCSRO72_1097 [Vibrio cholerae]GHY68642.1 hypothetical protein VCSRO168_2267 [Vibrio cholerae]
MNTLTKLLAATMTLSAQAMAATPLTLDVYNADGNSFHVNATVVYGETEAMVVDTLYQSRCAAHRRESTGFR